MSRRPTYRVRVIAGELKGRQLRYPDDRGLRPTMQRTKSSIFEALGGCLPGAVLVDLYCGAGAMGIEALSRGARRVDFVERDATALDFLAANLADCRLAADRFRIHAGDVLDVLRAGTLAGAAADIVLVDPPYATTDFRVLLALLSEIGYSGSGVVVLEHPSGLDIESAMPVSKTKTFGQTAVSFLRAGRGASQ